LTEYRSLTAAQNRAGIGIIGNHWLSFMYTGIVEQTGMISALTDSADGRRLEITVNQPMKDLKLGDSINISGCCFTAIEIADNYFVVQATHETLRRSKLGLLKVGDKVNLERPLKLEDRFGGHLVSGHVDAIAQVSSIKKEGFSKFITFTLPLEYAPFFVEKGSVTVDGVSLTVVDTIQNSGNKFRFSVALIPYTMEITTLGNLKVDETVNIETDLIAKYLARWLSLGNQVSMTKIFEALNTNELQKTDLEIKKQVCH
jgi:riboflavin synthase